MGFNSAFKGLNARLNPICHLLALLGAQHILYVSKIRVNFVCFSFFVPCLWSDQSELSTLLWFLICGMAQFLFWALQLTSKFSTPIFLLLPFDWICQQVHIVTGLVLLWCPVTDNMSIKEAHQVRYFFSWRRKQNWLPKRHIFISQSRKRRLFRWIATLFQRLVYLANVSIRVYLPNAAWSLSHLYQHSCTCPLDVTKDTDCPHTHVRLHAVTLYTSLGNTTTSLH